MTNKVSLQTDHYIDESLRPLTVGGKVTAIETAQAGDGVRISGDLEVTGNIIGIDTRDILIDDLTCDDITCDVINASGVVTANAGIAVDNITIDGQEIDVSSGNLSIDVAGNIALDAGGGTITFSDDGSDLCSFVKGVGTAMTMTPAGTFNLDAGGTITLDSHTGVFITKNAGTEFSAANSAYAGMMLGYTRISNNSTTTGHAEINPTATMAVLQTVQGTDVSVTFVAPPSGNVEISMLCAVYASSKTLEFALSDNASFNEVGETHTYDAGAQSSDETDQNMTYVSFVNTGLTPGTSYERWIAAAETVSGTSAIRHGRNRGLGTHYPPIIVKAIALPATITTGE